MMGPMSPVLVGSFFFSAWLVMVFWGIIAPGVDLPTISYTKAMLVDIALWLAALPLAILGGGKPWLAGGRHAHRHGRQPSGSDEVDLVAVFSGSTRRMNSKSFKGGKITAVFGGVELDLRDTVVAEKPAVLDITAVMGGAEIKVPSDWNVQMDIGAVFGGTSDERGQSQPASTGGPHLLINGSAVFGGVSVKS